MDDDDWTDSDTDAPALLQRKAKAFDRGQIEFLASVIATINNDANRRWVSRRFGDMLRDHQAGHRAWFNARTWNRECGNGVLED